MPGQQQLAKALPAQCSAITVAGSQDNPGTITSDFKVSFFQEVVIMRMIESF